MTAKIYTLDEIRAIAVPVARQYGVRAIYLFGSYARGDATAGSDIDLRIDRGDIRSLLVLGGLYADLEERLQKPLDIVTTQSLSSDFLRQISAEEVLSYAAS